MPGKLAITNSCSDNRFARVGGEALVGGVVGWPESPDGRPLTLLVSLPTEFLNRNAGFNLPAEHFISVFSYSPEDEYFLDCITYHGSQEELDWLRRGFTRVLFHRQGEPISSAAKLPSMRLEVDGANLALADSSSGSKIGGSPSLLQAEPLALNDEKFALQLYAGSFPAGYQGVMGLSDAVGYLFVSSKPLRKGEALDAGTFFIQVT
ncbi:MAG: hypothetical protein AB1437_06980 [Pseudomonadota bacterium]